MSSPRSLSSLVTFILLAVLPICCGAQQEPAQASPSDAVVAESVVVMQQAASSPCCDAAPSCCQAMQVHYRRCGKPCCCAAAATVPQVLLVADPCTGCCVPVTVCLPPCCDDCPSVLSRRGLLVKGVVHYRWCCGVCVRIVFLRCGDIVVDYL